MHHTMFTKIARRLFRRPARELRKSVLGFPNELLEPLWLQIVDGHSAPEIARRLRISEEEVVYRVCCARRTIYGIATN